MKLGNLKVRPKVEFQEEGPVPTGAELKKMTFEVKGIVCGL